MPAINCDLENQAPSVPYEPIPVGWYQAVITSSEEKPTKDGNGSYIQLTFEVIEGEFQGRKVFCRLNLNNPSDQAVAIARADLKAIVIASGLQKSPKTTEELHDIPMKIKVVIRPAKGEYGPSNEIKGYESIQKNMAQAKPATQQAATPAKPWARK